MVKHDIVPVLGDGHNGDDYCHCSVSTMVHKQGQRSLKAPR